MNRENNEDENRNVRKGHLTIIQKVSLSMVSMGLEKFPPSFSPSLED